MLFRPRYKRGIERERLEIDEAIGDMTLVDVLDHNAARFGNLPALQWSTGEGLRTISWAAYRERVTEVAAGLLSLGIEGGAFVALMTGNRAEHLIADLGVVYAGAFPVSFFDTLTPSEIRYIATHCEAEIAVVEDEGHLRRWDEIRGQLPELRYVVVMDLPKGHGNGGVLSWDELVARGNAALAKDPDQVDRSSAEVVQDDLVTVAYTPGTTGTPKAVMASHRNALWLVECSKRAWPQVSEHIRLISYLPFAHLGERMANHYSSLWMAGSIRCVPDLAMVVEAIRQTRPTAFFAPPRVWELFHAGLIGTLEGEPNARRRALGLRAFELAVAAQKIEQAGGRPGLFDSIKLRIFDRLLFAKIREGLGLDELEVGISAAAPISPDMLIFFWAIGLPVYELYGLTEASATGCTNLPGANRIGTVGRPLPGVEITTADDGEILMRGGVVTNGYYRDQDATSRTYDRDGWLHTGDLGQIDGDGFLTFLGRKQEIITTASGHDVAPLRLETLVGWYAPIAGVCLVGEGRSYLTLLISLDPDLAPGWADRRGVEYDDFGELSCAPRVLEEVRRIVESANGEVAPVEQVRKWYVVPDRWSPETGELAHTLRVRRDVVLERYAVEIDELYAD